MIHIGQIRDHRPPTRTRIQVSRRGFSLVETLVVVSIAVVIGAMSVPSIITITKTYTLSSTAHSLAGMINEAKLRAGSNFSVSRLSCTDVSGNTVASCKIDAYACTAGETPATCGTWTPVEVSQPLPKYITFQFGTITAVPSIESTQATPTETLTIYFNSRGVPITGSRIPTGDGGLYIRDSRLPSNKNDNTFAVMLFLSGRTEIYNYENAWVKQ